MNFQILPFLWKESLDQGRKRTAVDLRMISFLNLSFAYIPFVHLEIKLS
jgi:hypothetical protein